MRVDGGWTIWVQRDRAESGVVAGRGAAGLVRGEGQRTPRLWPLSIQSNKSTVQSVVARAAGRGTRTNGGSDGTDLAPARVGQFVTARLRLPVVVDPVTSLPPVHLYSCTTALPAQALFDSAESDRSLSTTPTNRCARDRKSMTSSTHTPPARPLPFVT